MVKARPANNEPVAAAVPNKDVLQRLSYLYQASILLNTALHAGAGTARGAMRKEREHDAESVKAFLIPTQADATTHVAGEQDAPGAVPPSPTLAALGDSVGSVVPPGSELELLPVASTNKARSAGHSALPATSRLLVKTMREVAKKATVRMDPAVKRTLCKGCGAVLVPGLTATVRIKPSGPHAHLIMTTCLGCRKQFRLPAPPHLPPDEGAVVPSNEGENAVDVKPGLESRQGANKRERKDQRRARRPTFFEREGHTTFAGTEKVAKH